MKHTNADILAAVLNRFLQPVARHLASAKLASFPLVQALENKVRSSGWVSPSWSLASEVAPVIEPVTSNLVGPIIKQYLKNVPDSAIPVMAHGIVDKALENGGLGLMEGRIQFEKNDLQELKKLLDYNLPLPGVEEYEVKLSAPEEIDLATAESGQENGEANENKG